ncbi:acyltransferase family protein [Pseudomonas sp. SC3(2021)]|uniref:acyltransferase family protein n=1 Tax=Pseudomonas sp. SC3(2021) TaxID=2871493 RepID=UPI001C9D7D88|nr:acyltransferase [Pseudomonas sp. SC3(2021)]
MLLSQKKSGNIPALTGLRFFAALMVFFSHFPIQTENQKLFLLQTSGFNGVTFFFVLSGFIIAYNYLDRFELNPLQSTPRFLLSRFARIYPLYIALIIFSWMNSGGYTPILPYILATQAWSGDLFVATGLNSPSWSISVEIFLYIIFPILIPVFRTLGILTSQNKLIALALIIISSQIAIAIYFSMPERASLLATDPASSHRWLYRGPAYRSLDFALGILAAIYYKRFFKHKTSSTGIWSFVTYSCIVYIFTLATSSTIAGSSFKWDAAYALPYTLLILSIVISSKTQIAKLLSGKKIVMLGEASFAFYLIHVLLGSMYIRQPTESMFFLIAHQALFLGFVISVSVGLHICIEKPCQKIILELFRKKEVPSKISIENQSAAIK